MKFNKSNQHIRCLQNIQIGDILEIYVKGAGLGFGGCYVSTTQTDSTRQFPVVARVKYKFEHKIDAVIGSKDDSINFWRSSYHDLNQDYEIIEYIPNISHYKYFYIPIPTDVKTKRIIKKILT